MPSTENPDRSAPKVRVLLVEDEIMVALLLEEMLAELDCEVVGPVSHLEKAVAMARQEAFDVAILDVNLNGEEVFPVASVLTARGVPFFFVTGYGRAGLRPPYADHPSLQKPFRRQALRDLFTEVCRAPQG